MARLYHYYGIALCFCTLLYLASYSSFKFTLILPRLFYMQLFQVSPVKLFFLFFFRNPLSFIFYVLFAYIMHNYILHRKKLFKIVFNKIEKKLNNPWAPNDDIIIFCNQQKILLKKCWRIFMSFKRPSSLNQKSYKNNTQRIFCSKDLTNQKGNKILTNNLLINMFFKQRVFTWT